MSLADALARRRAMESGSIWATDLHGGRLWLGAGRDARNLEQLRAHGITHILNCADDVPNYHDREPGLAYLRLEIVDFGGDKGSARVFPAAAEFARGALAEGGQGRVLVHCANGSNRSATVCAALFMDVYGLTLAEAWQRVHVREQAAPLGDNRKQLLGYELAVRGSNTMQEGVGGVLAAL